VLLLPIAVVGLVGVHVLLVRKHGVVPPFELAQRKAALAATGSPGGPPSPATAPPPLAAPSPDGAGTANGGAPS
jgi:ubiquinol-cytochrome c reductase cytochrome b subunit